MLSVRVREVFLVWPDFHMDTSLAVPAQRSLGQRRQRQGGVCVCSIQRSRIGIEET